MSRFDKLLASITKERPQPALYGEHAKYMKEINDAQKAAEKAAEIYIEPFDLNCICATDKILFLGEEKCFQKLQMRILALRGMPSTGYLQLDWQTKDTRQKWQQYFKHQNADTKFHYVDFGRWIPVVDLQRLIKNYICGPRKRLLRLKNFRDDADTFYICNVQKPIRRIRRLLQTRSLVMVNVEMEEHDRRPEQRVDTAAFDYVVERDGRGKFTVETASAIYDLII